MEVSGMYVDIDAGQLRPLIKAFYELSGIKIAIYDNHFEEVLTYPESNGAFCSMMNARAELWEKCEACTRRLCVKCANTKKTIVYKCHAGLTEVVAPLTDCGIAIGYVVYGQITDEPDHNVFAAEVVRRCRAYGLEAEEVLEHLEQIRYYTGEQLESTQQIIGALTSYIMMKNLVHVSDKPMVLQVLEYIESNLAGDLSVEALCKKFALSKSKLYYCVKDCMPEGIAKYVRRRRIESARTDLLRNPDKPLWKVAEDVGFENYEYFLRVFREETGGSIRALKRKAPE